MTSDSENYNDNERQVPEWLTKQFFTKVLKKCENDDSIESLDLKIQPAGPKGDHYGSSMFRIQMEYRQKNDVKKKSMIIKILPEAGGPTSAALEDSKIFETENGIYSKAIPKMEKLLRDAGIDVTLAPQCLYHSLSPHKFVILEDITVKGYSVLGRDRRMTLEEMKAAYAKLAKWHAASYKIAEEEPHYFDEFKYGFFTVTYYREQNFFKNAGKRFIDMLKTQPALLRYIPYFEKILENNLFDQCTESFTEYFKNFNAKNLYVLCHGDFHCRNMMFRNDATTNELEDLLLLDFQFSYMGPIVNDLIYSIYMLLYPEMRRNHLQELFYYYFKTLQDTLKKLNFKGEMPKMIDFQKQLMDHKHFKLFLLITFLPMWYNIFEGPSELEKMMSSEEYCRQVWSNPQYVNELHEILPKYLHKGYLEA